MLNGRTRPRPSLRAGQRHGHRAGRHRAARCRAGSGWAQRCRGEKIDLLGIEFEVMHLPGHSMGCTAYFFEYEGKKIVVSGDIIGTLLDGYHGWSGSIDFNKEKYLESLQRFSKIDTDLMLPGHGMIYFHKPRRRVEEAWNLALIEWR